MAYYECALELFQRVNCRMIAKALICLIEPKRQVKHPYTGKVPAGSALGMKENPEPPNVMQKDPDHLRKEQRIQLLRHTICKLGSYNITADALANVVNFTVPRLQDQSRARIIYEILRVRKMEERFEQGRVGKYSHSKPFAFD
ncbi:unnamed protein product [Penicillium glandicola]